jgi:four helix bundle protein
MEKENIVLDITFDFALQIIIYCELLEEKRRFVISHQLLKSGTSIGANIREAQSAESKTDFIHKMKISSKEAEETEYWLLLCKHSKSYPSPDQLLDKIIVIKKILSKIIATSKISPK